MASAIRLWLLCILSNDACTGRRAPRYLGTGKAAVKAVCFLTFHLLSNLRTTSSKLSLQVVCFLAFRLFSILRTVSSIPSLQDEAPKLEQSQDKGI